MNPTIDEFSDIIARYTIVQWEIETASSRFKAEIHFIDHTILAVKDYHFPSGRKYAYHWQDMEGDLICRWDNAPHWREFKTFPYHKHEKGDIVFPSNEMTLGDVLRHISDRLKSGS